MEVDQQRRSFPNVPSHSLFATPPKEELSLRESIYLLRDKLRNALKKGYIYQDLSELLEEKEILISAATLKQYLTAIEKGATKEKRGAKSVKALQPSPEAISSEEYLPPPSCQSLCPIASNAS